MRRFVLSFAAATAIVSAASLAPANAMTVGTAHGIQSAIQDGSLVEDVAYVCRHRSYRSGRVCWWRPGGYYRGYRGGYRGYRYGGYRRWSTPSRRARSD